MLAKKKAIEILEELIGRIPSLEQRQALNNREFVRWRRDVERAIETIFPGRINEVQRFSTIVFVQGSLPEPASPDNFRIVVGIQEAEGILRSMVEEVRGYWIEDGNSVSPYGPQSALHTSPGLPSPTANPRTVFVVHGRNGRARRAMFEFLRAINLNPLEWTEIRKATGKTNPYIGEILEKGFSMARAVLVLWTPDDEVQLKLELRKTDDPPYEAELSGQARPNVLFEAGMAMGLHSERTVLAQLGDLRPFSDIGGRHLVRLDNSPQCRKELASRLASAGCDVNLDGDDWMTAGQFELEKPPLAQQSSRESAASDGKSLEKHPIGDGLDGNLTALEKDIIISTGDHGWIYTMTSDFLGRMVQNLYKENDHSYQSSCLDALDALIAKRLVRSEGRPDWYRLTGRGFEVRNGLKASGTTHGKSGNSNSRELGEIEPETTKIANDNDFLEPLPRLTPEESEIIGSTSPDGNIAVKNVMGSGSWVSTYDREFNDRTDPSIQLHYIDILNTLHAKKLVRPTQNGCFILTPMGLKIREKLKSSEAP
jgi:predicted nucleotide-binding protein